MAGKNTSNLLGWVSLVVALSTCAIVGFAVAQSPKTITAKELQDRRVQFDPALGRKFDVDGARFVVAIGDCASCSVQNTDFNKLKALDTETIVGFYKPGADTGPITKDYDWFHLKEDKTDLHTRLNAFFSPRVYVFAEDGSLLAVQKPNEPLEAFLKRVKM